jgi:hypothetical protein
MLPSGVRVAPTAAILHRIDPFYEEETMGYVSMAHEIYCIEADAVAIEAKFSHHSADLDKGAAKFTMQCASPPPSPAEQRRSAVLVSQFRY